MQIPDNAAFGFVLDWLASGFLRPSWWQLTLYIVLSAHLTVIAESVFLHRCLTHRSIALGPVPAHFFRFWLWLTMSVRSQRWVAVHRKHHASSDLPDDPHSPQQQGLWTVFWQGSDIVQVAGTNPETVRKYGHGTPDDWLERRIYSRWPRLGIYSLLLIDLLLFGVGGLAVWALKLCLGLPQF